MLSYDQKENLFVAEGGEHRVFSELGRLVNAIAETRGEPDVRDPLPEIEEGAENDYLIVEYADTSDRDWTVKVSIRRDNGGNGHYFLEELMGNQDVREMLEKGKRSTASRSKASEYPLKINF